MDLEFINESASRPIIKVIGVGGGGCNAVNYMYRQGIREVEFYVCNTDNQALANSPVPNKIRLGETLTEGRGAGSNPEVGKNAAIESLDKIQEILRDNTKMVFITAGMGGGTGTGAAPIIAEAAKNMGILTVGIVTMPFAFEGKKRLAYAQEGLKEMRKNVDTLLVINNSKIREIYGNLKFTEAFAKADNILCNAAKSIAEIITVPGYINVDFEDVKTVTKDGGTAIMGTGMAEGENRAIEAITMAMESPLLDDNDIAGANSILLYILSASGENEVTMDEITEITDYISEKAGNEATIIWGNGFDDALGGKISVTIIATGFHKKSDVSSASGEVTDERFSLPKVNLKSDVSSISTPKESAPITKIVDIMEDEKKNQKDGIRPVDISSVPEEPTLFSQNPVGEDNKTSFLKSGESLEEIKRKQQKESKTKMQEIIRKVQIKRESMRIEDMEKIPAFKREKGFSLPDNEQEFSRYTLNVDEDNKPRLSEGNSFLHDNVD